MIGYQFLASRFRISMRTIFSKAEESDLFIRSTMRSSHPPFPKKLLEMRSCMHAKYLHFRNSKFKPIPLNHMSYLNTTSLNIPLGRQNSKHTILLYTQRELSNSTAPLLFPTITMQESNNHDRTDS